jgi:hypothetical protein
MKIEQTGCFEILGYKIQMLGNYPNERILQITDLKENIISEQADVALDLSKQK